MVGVAIVDLAGIEPASRPVRLADFNGLSKPFQALVVRILRIAPTASFGALVIYSECSRTPAKVFRPLRHPLAPFGGIRSSPSVTELLPFSRSGR